jgi:NADH-quinone oxidoreductase subunit J
MAIISAICVVTFKNPVSSAMMLVTHFISLSGLYLTLNAQFLAALQIMVYAGAIMVLVVFVIMLLNSGNEESFIQKFSNRKSLSIALSISLGGLLIIVISKFVFSSKEKIVNIDVGSIQGIGKALFGNYIFPFEMISLVLLAATVGAVSMTKKHLEN